MRVVWVAGPREDSSQRVASARLMTNSIVWWILKMLRTVLDDTCAITDSYNSMGTERDREGHGVLSHLYMLTNCLPMDSAPECRSSMEACSGGKKNRN